jgi:hypothetical protein
MRAMAVLALLLTACSDDDFCNKQSELNYSCLPVAASASTCTGGPLLRVDPNNVEVVADPDKSFPVGCEATFATCDQFRSCTCTQAGSATPAWECPL